MNVFRYECRRYVITSLIWALALTAFAYLCIQLYLIFTVDMNFFEQMLASYSPELLKAFGAELRTIKTLTGFYSFCFMYIMVAAAFQSIHLGMHVVSKEISNKSADFLFTKPQSRTCILNYKLCSVILCIVVVNVMYCIGSLISANMTGISYDVSIMLYMSGALFLTQLLFLSLGFCLGCVLKKVKSPLSLSTGIISGFFVLQMIVNLEPNGFLSYVSFLNYLSGDSIIVHHGYDVVKLMILLAFTLLFLIIGYTYFHHRDIHTA